MADKRHQTPKMLRFLFPQMKCVMDAEALLTFWSSGYVTVTTYKVREAGKHKKCRYKRM